MEQNQIVDAIYFIQWKIRVNAVGERCTGNEPAAADTASELVTFEGIGPVHDELKVIQLSPKGTFLLLLLLSRLIKELIGGFRYAKIDSNRVWNILDLQK